MGTEKPSSEDFVFKPFRDLKKILDSKKKGVPTKSVSAKKDKPISDEELFIDVMKEVQEIKDFRKIPVNKNSPPIHIKELPLIMRH